jgi:hypothetical protein
VLGSLLWEPCSEGTFRTKTDESDQPRPRFDSFAVLQALTCSSLGMGDPRAFAERAESVLDATLSYGIESALTWGVTGSTNPFLDDGGATVLGGGAVTPEVALGLLEEAIAATGRRGMIHAPPRIASAWSFDGGLSSNGEVLETWLGTPVATGGGYTELSAGAPVTGNISAWATGPVEVRLAEVSVQPISEVLDRSDNTVTFRAERYALAIWDTCLQVAVEIDFTP